MATVGGLWSYNNGVMEHISDPFAAMPSLHIAWATWCSVALWPLLRRRWQRSLLVGYPFLTAFTVLATGTHWLLDLVAGGAALAMAWLLLRWRPRRNLDTSWRGLGGGASVRPGIVDSDDAHTG
jgi:membrane-associated phospholipid phosphatase